MQYDEIVEVVARNTGLDKGIVNKIYRAYWRAIREYIVSLPLKQELTEEEFTKIRPNINIPSIGKLYVTYDRYKRLREDYLQQTNSNKDATHNED